MAVDDSFAARIPAELRQAALDAAAVLQVRRSEVVARLERGESCGATVVAAGSNADLNRWMRDDCVRWRDLLSVKPAGFVPQLQISLPQNRRLIADGLQMISLFSIEATGPESRCLLAGEEVGEYRLGVCPVQMKVIDRRYVLLNGPCENEESSIMEVTAPDCLDAAWRYWHAALAASIPAEEGVPTGLSRLTPRQRQVVALLTVDTRDEAIAETLDISVRTVRSDIADLMDALGVRSRFAAGIRVKELLRDL
ncbi:helix-turn-helix transcriptional regulator [Nocardioides sp.]|uniref:helix-turn-helix transcriptional regulator n=1 Tax=Nocardioides sp. TaxID=35761 RepID=UPI002ED8D1FB